MDVLNDNWSLAFWKSAMDSKGNVVNLPTKIITSNGVPIVEFRWNVLKGVTAQDIAKVGRFMVKANKMVELLNREVNSTEDPGLMDEMIALLKEVE